MNGQMLLALRRQIRKYLTMTASDLMQTLPELASMSARSIQHHLHHLHHPQSPQQIHRPEAPLNTEDEEEEAFFLQSLEEVDC
jgi:hypothetical protein